MEDVGGILNVTRERVRQIEVKALRRIGISKMGKFLEGYL